MGADIYDLYNTEISYQPIFSTPEDALNTLASQAIDIFEGKIKNIEIPELEKKKDEFIIVDIREKEKFEISHIKNAINIPTNQINPEDFKNKNKYLIYCQSGIMAKSVVNNLQKQGLNNIYYLEGSMNYLEKYQKAMGVHILE